MPFSERPLGIVTAIGYAIGTSSRSKELALKETPKCFSVKLSY